MLLLSLLYVGDRQQQKREEKSEHRRWDKVEWLMRCDDFVEVFFFWKDEKISIHSRMQWIYLVLLCAPTHNPLKHSECVESRSSDDDDDDDDERAAAEKKRHRNLWQHFSHSQKQYFSSSLPFFGGVIQRRRRLSSQRVMKIQNFQLRPPPMNDGEKKNYRRERAAEATDDIWNSRMRRLCSQINAKWMSLFHSRPASEKLWIDNFRRPGQLNPQTVTTAQKSLICDTFSGRWWKSCPKKHTTPHTQHSPAHNIF